MAVAHGFAFARLRPPDYSDARWLGYLLNGQLQGKLLSAHKISQPAAATIPFIGLFSTTNPRSIHKTN